jgi:hypothetical protein
MQEHIRQLKCVPGSLTGILFDVVFVLVTFEQLVDLCARAALPRLQEVASHLTRGHHAQQEEARSVHPPERPGFGRVLQGSHDVRPPRERGLSALLAQCSRIIDLRGSRERQDVAATVGPCGITGVHQPRDPLVLVACGRRSRLAFDDERRSQLAHPDHVRVVPEVLQPDDEHLDESIEVGAHRRDQSEDQLGSLVRNAVTRDHHVVIFASH